MKIWFKNANIFNDNKIVKGDVVVFNDEIVFVGEDAETNFFKINRNTIKETTLINSIVDRVIDVKGNILMSGFVNAHAHTPSTILRGMADDMSLHDWLDKIIPLEKSLTDEDIYYSTLLGLAEYAKAGITCVEENYSRLHSVVKAYKDSGLRARISIGFPDVNVDKPEFSLNEELKFVNENGYDAVCYAHSLYGTSLNNFDKLNTFAKINNLFVSTHISETLKEVGDCSVEFGLTPVEQLEYLGFFDRPATVYHCVHADKDDISLLADYNVNVVTCPSSNLKLASGIAPIFALQNAGINIAIGTDGAYSNNSYDMFKEMFLVATLNKAILYNGEIIKAHEVLNMATKNGAKALGLENKIGQIKVGLQADLILIDTNGIHNQPKNNLISNLVYSTKSSDVYLTMVKGKIIYEDGQLFFNKTLDEIIQKCEQIRKRLLTQT